MTRKTITLDEMVAALRAAYDGADPAIVLYGSAASDSSGGEPGAAHGDYNLLVVADDGSAARLARASEAVSRWAAAGNPPPLFFTRPEWEASADIFPIEYADVLESHRVLHGAFATRHLEIKTEHLRLQLEQEAMGKLIWLRQGAMIAGSNAAARLRLLEGSFSKLLVVCRGILRLNGDRPPIGKADIVTTAARVAGFSPDPLLRVMRSRAGERIPEGESDKVIEGVLRALQQIVAHVNSVRPTSQTYSAAWAGSSTGERPK